MGIVMDQPPRWEEGGKQINAEAGKKREREEEEKRIDTRKGG